MNEKRRLMGLGNELILHGEGSKEEKRDKNLPRC
jgi:hypothetical protein